ncbi:YfbM family protein [Lysinibacillus pakistanensis]|uniref:YfbM family protein n=1 Tax=Lysinibacillus pakistanensis TaxID=759811 RepID=A0AAX3WZN5_9BACI|nr:YfbM family protein [Lysinibacillus pakistanensis]MDM5232820.1 YfbM family protein [Lysinibacillus pakistanensis]WHY48318.1 YfbM family protein [Lysinibacillus pakistanensis]WHY53331.1 YfbM family protein [Lysinibacillus pakistanensis]
MGMIGYYIALPEEEIQQLAARTKMLEDMDPYNRENLDIDKSWQALYYLLCEDICDGGPPLGYVVPMDQANYLEFGDIGAFYLTHRQICEAYQAIEAMTRDELLAKYNYNKMLEEDIYPLYSDGEEKDGEAEQFFDYLYSYFKDIRKFFAETISEGKGLVFCIS